MLTVMIRVNMPDKIILFIFTFFMIYTKLLLERRLMAMSIQKGELFKDDEFFFMLMTDHLGNRTCRFYGNRQASARLCPLSRKVKILKAGNYSIDRGWRNQIFSWQPSL